MLNITKLVYLLFHSSFEIHNDPSSSLTIINNYLTPLQIFTNQSFRPGRLLNE